MSSPTNGRRLRFGVAAGVALMLAGCSLPRQTDERADAGALTTGDPPAAVSGAGVQRTSGAALPSVSETAASRFVPAFSKARSGDLLPPGWESWIIHPRKKPTRYGVVVDGGRSVLRAQASSSASGLLAKVNVDVVENPYIEWTWRTETVLEEADNLVASLEDSPARVVLAFEGDRTTLPLKDQLFFERVKLFTGVEMPYATLMYIWGNRKPVESVLQNPHTQRIQKIVVNNGESGVKRWHRQRRNIVEDYRRAFGRSPGRLVGVAVMTDSDNTQGEVVAYYGDIRLLGKTGGEGLSHSTADEFAAGK